ncbi:hypothetical protein T10_11985 [Trichinella papuae]|uniref:Uncharacterized protein n=1 Tax=Trichinella papuae TaxID=268474 RepID=A0A0V1MPA5_9BILA|nr:hypothetical protein T10_11985 [Trichinella papuae]
MLGKKKTINAELYVLKMHGLSLEIEQKRFDLRHGVLVQHDNAALSFFYTRQCDLRLGVAEYICISLYGHVVILTDNHCSIELSSGAVQECFFKLCNFLKDRRFFKDFRKRGSMNSSSQDLVISTIDSLIIMPKNSSTTMEPVESKETQLEEKPGTLQVSHGWGIPISPTSPRFVIGCSPIGCTEFDRNWANGQQHLISYSALIRDWMIVFYPSFSKYGRSSSKLPYMDIDNHIPNF